MKGELYGVETRSLNQAVKRNALRFPKDFMFQLTAKEWYSMRSQNVIGPSQKTENQSITPMRSQNVTASKRNSAALPYAFTEHGVTMLSSILKSPVAIQLSIEVVRAFLSLKRLAGQQGIFADKLHQIEERLGEHDTQLKSIYDAIENLLEEKVEQKCWQDRERIGFKIKD